MSDRRASAADAIAVLAADQAYQGRVLGPADPAPVPRTTTAVPVTGQINPVVTAGITTSDTLGTSVGTGGTVATQSAIAPATPVTAPVSASVPALAPVATTPMIVTNANGAAVRVVNSNGAVSVTNTSTNSGNKKQ